MDVDVLCPEVLVCHFGKLRMGLDVLVGDRGGLLHHIAEVAGHRHDTLASADRTLHEQYLAAHLGPGQSRDHSRSLVALLQVMEISRQSEIFLKMLLLDDRRIVLAQGDLLGSHTRYLGDLLLKAADSGLAGILIDDPLQRRLVDAEFLLAYSMLLQLLRHQITLGDLHLLLGKVAGDVDQLHPIKKRRLDRGDVVGRGDEQDVRQVVVNVQIVVMERRILLRVKYFQKSRRRVALVVVAHLVDLVKDDDGIGCPGLVDAVQNTSRESADVGFPMATELRLVVHAAEGYPDIFPAESLGDRLSEAGLADSRRAVEAEDRRLHVALQLEDGKVLDDPFLHCVKAVVVAVENLLRMLEVKVVLRHLAPRQVKHELYVVVLDAVVRRGRIVLLQLGQLLLELLANGLRPLLGLRLRAEPLEFLLLVHSKLLLDGTELIVKVIFPLLLVDVALDLLVDLLLDLKQLDLRVQNLQELHRPHGNIINAKKLHLLKEVLDLHRRRDEVDKERIVVDGFQGPHGLLRSEGRGLDDDGGFLLERLRYHLRAVVILRDNVLDVLHPRRDVRLVGDDTVKTQALDALEDGSDRAVRHLKNLHDAADGAIFIEIPFLRLLHRDIHLRHGSDEGVAFLRILDQGDGFPAAYRDRIDHTREDHRVPQRQNRQCVRQIACVNLHLILPLHDRDYVHFRGTCREENVLIIISNHNVQFKTTECRLPNWQINPDPKRIREYGQSPCQKNMVNNLSI